MRMRTGVFLCAVLLALVAAAGGAVRAEALGFVSPVGQLVAAGLAPAVADGSGTAVTPAARTSALTFTITPSVVGGAAGHGSISPDTPVTVASGGTPTFLFIPDEGCRVSVVTVDGAPVTLADPAEYTFPPVTADHTISVTFVSDGPPAGEYTITPSVVGGANGHGTISPDTPVSVAAGESPDFLFMPEPYYHVSQVTVDGVPVTLTDDSHYTFPPVSANHTISVTFAGGEPGPTQYTITPSVVGGAGGHGTVSPATPQTVAAGATPTFTFTPESGYKVGTVTVDGTAVAMTAANAYTFPAVAANHALSVTFVAESAPTQYTITPSVVGGAAGHGTISPATPQTVAAGATRTFTFTPESGYKVGTVTVDGTGVAMTAANAFTFPAVTANHAIAVTFVADAPAPVITTAAPLPATVKKGRMATLKYRVDGPATIGSASVTITIKNRAGLVVARKGAKGVPLNSLQALTFRCTLNRGTYTFSVSAVADTGERSTTDGFNTLTVK